MIGTLTAQEIERLVPEAGYGGEAPVVVGVQTPEGQIVVAHGRTADGCRADPLARGYAASLAKQVTGACAASLVLEGALDVDAPITIWLDELPDWAEQIGVRDLLHHTAGLPPTGAIWTRMEESGEVDWTSRGVLRALTRFSEPSARPGEEYAYSNAGYVCLATIIERVGGSSLDVFARARLFEPHGMQTSLFWSGPGASPRGEALARPDGPPFPLSVGDGGFWTTIADLLRWNDALLLDSPLRSLVHAPGTLVDGTHVPYGWGVGLSVAAGRRVESHGGRWEGTAARLVRLPDLGAGFAVLAGDDDLDRILRLSASLQDALTGRLDRASDGAL